MVEYLHLTARIEPGEEDEGGFVSYCPELDVASQGETVEEAFANLKDAIDTYVDALQDLGDLDGVLRERGLHPMTSEPREHQSVDVGPRQFVTSVVATFDAHRVTA